MCILLAIVKSQNMLDIVFLWCKLNSRKAVNILLLTYSFALNLILCKQANMHYQIRFPHLHSSDEHSEMLRFQFWYKV